MTVAIIEVQVGGMVVSVTETLPIANIEVSMPGTQGPRGPGISSGEGAPVSSGGSGDIYIDTLTGDIYTWS